MRQFTRAFRQETGESPAKAVEALRVEVARVMLEEGSHSVEEVADATGFGSRERMRRVFVRAFGRRHKNSDATVARWVAAHAAPRRAK